MTTRRLRLSCLLVGLALSGVACSRAGASNPAGSGGLSADLVERAADLSNLHSYRAVLTRTFEGTVAGSPAMWTETWTHTIDRPHQVDLLHVVRQSLEGDPAPDEILTGTAGGVLYDQIGSGSDCTASVAETSDGPALKVQPVMLLPTFRTEGEAVQEVIDGIQVERRSIDPRSLSVDGVEQASGQVWLALQEGQIVRLEVTIQGTPDLFGDGVEGTLATMYRLEEIDSLTSSDVPPQCPPGLVEAALPDGAANVVQEPGRLSFTASGTPSVLADFYRRQLAQAGWSEDGNGSVTAEGANLAFLRRSEVLLLTMKPGDRTDVSLVLVRGDSPEAALFSSGSGPGQDIATRIGGSLNLTLGIASPSPFASFHLEAHGADPAYDPTSGKVLVSTVDIDADVAGPDYYLVSTSTRGDSPPERTEGYFVGGRDLEKIGDSFKETAGDIELVWALWPLGPINALAVGALGATPAGQDAVDGRSADVYQIDTTQAEPASLEALAAFSSVRSATGRVWLDAQTGALLKADLEYKAEFVDPSNALTVIGTGEGRWEIEVTRVGTVAVRAP